MRPVSWTSLSFSLRLPLSPPTGGESQPPGGRQLSRRRQSAFRGDVACTAERHTRPLQFSERSLSVFSSSPFSLFCLRSLSLFSLSLSAFLSSLPPPSLRLCLSTSLSLLSCPSSSNTLPPCRSSTWLATLRSGYSATKSPSSSSSPRGNIYIYTYIRCWRQRNSQCHVSKQRPVVAVSRVCPGVVNCARAPENSLVFSARCWLVRGCQ